MSSAVRFLVLAFYMKAILTSEGFTIIEYSNGNVPGFACLMYSANYLKVNLLDSAMITSRNHNTGTAYSVFVFAAAEY